MLIKIYKNISVKFNTAATKILLILKKIDNPGSTESKLLE